MAGVEVFWGSEPEYQSEREFFARLRSHLEGQQLDALMLANFYLSNALQVDFLVVLPDHRMCHIELKHYVLPLVDEKNGPWKAVQADGSLQEIKGQNPYARAVRQRFALSDDLRSFAEENASTPHTPGKNFYRWFDSVVCIFPELAAGSSVPSDYKVKTLGYRDMLALLTNSTQRFPWDRPTWLEFIRHLSLTSANAASKRLRRSDVHSKVEGYRQAFADFYGRNLHELVPTPLVTNDSAVTAPDVLTLLRDATSVQLLGESGSGKSHLATHAALADLASWGRCHAQRLIRCIDLLTHGAYLLVRTPRGRIPTRMDSS